MFPVVSGNAVFIPCRSNDPLTGDAGRIIIVCDTIMIGKTCYHINVIHNLQSSGGSYSAAFVK